MKKTTLGAAVLIAALASSLSVAVALAPPVLTTDVAKVTYPGVVTLTASLTAESPAATFKMLTPGATSYSVLGTVPASYADPGVHHFIVRPRRNATYTVEVDGMISEPVFVPVYVPLSLPTSKAFVRVNTTAAFTGTIRPVHPGPNIDVQFERWNVRTRRWERKLTTAVAGVAQIGATDTTRWTFSRSFRRVDVGSWRVRASHACVNHAQSYSSWKRFAVL
ncbi:MAG: hypothetical protein U1E26_08430 [Coriobacteriia bacterium]|nr:hypothetical protein [Coriobacteriia bacterium]